jgi:hypothetical protein
MPGSKETPGLVAEAGPEGEDGKFQRKNRISALAGIVRGMRYAPRASPYRYGRLD